MSKLNITQGNKLRTLLERHPNKRNYYPRSSFPDVQFEEDVLHPSSEADGASLTEWNIDGMAEGQIYSKLQEMGMNITAYKMKGAGDKESANMIIAGFTGTLKNWWVNYLTDHNRSEILSAVTTKTVIKTEDGTNTSSEVVYEDAIATLLYSIAKHFVGEPRLF